MTELNLDVFFLITTATFFSFAALLFALIIKGNRRKRLFLAAIFLNFALLFSTVLAKDFSGPAWLVRGDLLFGYLTGPLIFLHVRNLRPGENKSPLILVASFAPAIVGILAMITTISLPEGFYLAMVGSVLFFVLLSIHEQRHLQQSSPDFPEPKEILFLTWLRRFHYFLVAIILVGILQHLAEAYLQTNVSDVLTTLTLGGFWGFILVFLIAVFRQPGLVKTWLRSGLQGDYLLANSTLMPAHEVKAVQQAIQRVVLDKELFRDGNLQISDIAKETGYATATVSEAIKRGLGGNFFDYLNGLRIGRAKKMLSEQNASVTEVMLVCGFNSKSSFYTEFTKRVGVSPGTFRKSIRK